MDYKLLNNELLSYRLYLENNIQYITEINKTIERLILKLEKEHISINECFLHLENQINLLLKVYSNFKTLGAYEYCLKLKSLINKYHDVTNTQIKLSALYYIHSKILSLQEEQLKHFPHLYQEKSLLTLSKSKSNKGNFETILNTFPYKWITFNRNNMWFVVLFDSYQLLTIADLYNLKCVSHNYYIAQLHDITITIRDPLSLNEPPSSNILCIHYHNQYYGYFYDFIGKKLSAKSDVLLQKTKISEISTVRPTYGRIRLFGNNYIYLKHIDITTNIETCHT